MAHLDASMVHQARCGRVKEAILKYSNQNAYYLFNAYAVFRLVNSQVIGMLRFQFEGVVLTDGSHRRTEAVDLEVELVSDTCDWLTDRATQWFEETVQQAVFVEFDRYITSGGLRKTVELTQQIPSSHHFLGMNL